MSKQSINKLVDGMAHLDHPEIGGVEKALATKFRQTDQSDEWTFYEAEIADGPFPRAEFRVRSDSAKALLGLWPDATNPPAEKDVDLNRWGPIHGIDVNPRIQPEGTDAYIFDVDGVRVSFQFHHHSRTLRSIAIEWGATQLD